MLKAAGSIQPDKYIDIELDETPVWLVSVPSNSGSIWLAASANGELAGYMVSADGTLMKTSNSTRHPSL